MYQLTLPNKPDSESRIVVRLADNAFIPFDPANRDYADYLAWLAEGNFPAPADEINQGEPQ